MFLFRVIQLKTLFHSSTILNTEHLLFFHFKRYVQLCMFKIHLNMSIKICKCNIAQHIKKSQFILKNEEKALTRCLDLGKGNRNINTSTSAVYEKRRFRTFSQKTVVDFYLVEINTSGTYFPNKSFLEYIIKLKLYER